MNTKRSYSLIFFILIPALFFSIFISGTVLAKDSDDDNSYVITTYNDRNGLPTREANTILQTSDGYIWIGSYGGLIRYDGTSFTNYSLNGSIEASSIRSLFEDSDNRLLIGTNDKGILILENNTFYDVSRPGDYDFSCIRDFTQTSDGRIYVASNSGIAYLDGNSLIPIDIPEIEGHYVYNVSADIYDRIWFTTDSDYCGILDSKNKATLFYSGELFDKERVYCVACNGNKVYIGSDSNVCALITLDSESTDLSELTVSHFFTENVYTHNRISFTKDNDLLIAGQTGLYFLDVNGNTTIFDENDYAYSACWAIEDFEGNIWLASSGIGVTRFSMGYFYNANAVSHLDGLSLNCITRATDKFYIGTDNGLIMFSQSWSPIDKSITKELAGVRVRQVLAASNNTVWIATYNGIYNYNPSNDSFSCLTVQDGLPSNRIRCILELANGDIAVGTQSGIGIVHSGQIIKTYSSADGFANSSILCMLQEEDGTILCGTDGGGIYTIKDDTVVCHDYNNGLEDGVVLRILRDKSGRGYFVSAGSSLYYWDRGSNQFKLLTNWDKSAGSIFDMYEKNGYLWVLQNKGLLAVDKEQLVNDIPAETITYSFSHGLTGSLNANSWNYLDDNENLYLATSNGVCIFHFEEIINPIPMGIISSIAVDDVIYDNPTEITIPSDTRRITISFSSFDYSGMSTLTSSYILEGFDSDKTVKENSGGESISYTNLPGGDYEFVLYIYDTHNPNTKKCYTLSIHKEKHITEYVSFWVVMFLILVLLINVVIYFFSRIKIQRLKKHADEYQDIVEQSLKTFAKTIDAKDKYTNGHSIRVAIYSRELAKRIGLSDKEQENIYYIAMLHDIGKIGIPDSILNKPGKLTKEEMETIQTHPSIGGDILKDFTAIPDISLGAEYHHERFDGTGYCTGKKGAAIPLIARIIGVADTYDAMSSDRCYRNALSPAIIVEELKKASGTQLDPDIVKHMLDMIKDKSVPYKL